MTTHTTRSKALLALAGMLIAAFTLPALAAASTPAHLRVVSSTGKTLAQQTQYTGTVSIKTNPEATCFGPGTGGSGDVVKVTGPTALGEVADAATFDRAVDPLSVTDSFDFGLGICGFGRAVAPSTGFWYLKVNHVASQVGGDQAAVAAGDDVLWYLDSDFSDAPPGELFLDAPARAKPGTKFKARVVSYADDGTRTPVEGANVTGAEDPTDATGKATVSFPNSGPRVMQATRAGDIPSNQVSICLEISLSDCSAQPGERIFGTARSDRIAGTDGDDAINSGAGADVLDIRSGGADKVQCGSGKDKVIGVSSDDHVGRSCERPTGRA